MKIMKTQNWHQTHRSWVIFRGSITGSTETKPAVIVSKLMYELTQVVCYLCTIIFKWRFQDDVDMQQAAQIWTVMTMDKQ